ncbi:DNA-directed RNA polymerase subunit omega [Fusobacterium vincentii]|nr:DNA-directed RNA polymerase subunit omega [Fusobacterium vincentii]
MKKEITYDELLDKISNKYILTIVAGERARERAKERVERGGELYHLQNMIRKILR